MARRSRQATTSTFHNDAFDYVAECNAPPPSYDEVVKSTLYPVVRRGARAADYGRSPSVERASELPHHEPLRPTASAPYLSRSADSSPVITRRTTPVEWSLQYVDFIPPANPSNKIQSLFP